MKKLVLLVCVFVLLIVATGAVSAGKPAPDQFTITGYTTQFETEVLPSGLTKFQATASGTVTSESEDGFDGATFTFEEWGIGSLDPVTWEARGTNHGIMTITKGCDDEVDICGEVVIRFDGQADLFNVWGNYRILQGSGQYAGLRGEGTYLGITDNPFDNPDEGFYVDFSGKFHSQP